MSKVKPRTYGGIEQRQIMSKQTRMTVDDLLTNRKGEINFIVPKGTLVMKDNRIWASQGDHIHGHRDRAGVSVEVFAAINCVECLAE